MTQLNPHTGDPTNAQRAAWAYRALQAYVQAKGEADTLADRPDNIGDLICDLLHLATEYGGHETILSAATSNFEIETQEKQP